MGRIGAQALDVVGEESQLLEGIPQRRLLRMADHLGVELRLIEARVDVALELDHVDAVGGEAAEGLVQRRRHVAYLEQEAGDHRALVGWRLDRLARQDDEPGGVVLGVLEVGTQDLEAVDLGREPRCDRRLITPPDLGHLGGRARGVGMDSGRDPQLAQQLSALVEGMDVRVHRLDVLEPCARHRQEVMVHAQEMLADDVQAAVRHQVMDVGDPAGDRIVDRDHRPVGLSLADGGERLLEGLDGHGLVARADLPAGEMGVGAGLALKHDPPGQFDRRWPVKPVSVGRLIHDPRLGS